MYAQLVFSLTNYQLFDRFTHELVSDQVYTYRQANSICAGDEYLIMRPVPVSVCEN